MKRASMVTKSTKKTTTKKPATRKAKVAPAKAKASAPAQQRTVRECINESEVLRFHMQIITVLSVLVCVLVAALVYTLTR